MPNNIIYFAPKKRSEVIFYKENTKAGTRFGVHYRIGDDIDDTMLDEIKATCDTIAYREHCRSHLGKYPDDDVKVYFEMPGRVHNVSFMDIPSIDVYRIAELISECLKVNCTTSFNNPLIVTTQGRGFSRP